MEIWYQELLFKEKCWVKSLLGTWCGFISSTSSERARFHLQITAIKFLSYFTVMFILGDFQVTYGVDAVKTDVGAAKPTLSPFA